MNEFKKIYESKRYFALALDPIYIGTGGYRIGRVDNTIIREPTTGIPKIPGTSIEGVCRNYAYLQAKANEENVKLPCAKGKKVNNEEPCGKCRICITFGYTKEGEALQAMTLFSDARILFFPVATMIGPVWVTCPMVLKEAGIKENNEKRYIPEPEEGKFIVPKNSILNPPKGKLNFGWLLLKRDSSKETDINKWTYQDNNNRRSLKDVPNLKDILKRIVVVPNELFSTIVNSNLEVRTSVAIDPERGAAEERALFTYEAIPRGTVFWFDVIYQNPEHFPAIKEIAGCNNIKTKLDCIIRTVEEGFELFEHLGIGGMSSRGFGRLKVLNIQINGDKNDG